jgi:hypothetical protein
MKNHDLSFDLSVEKLNILLNNTYVKESIDLTIDDNVIVMNFIDTHGNNKFIKSSAEFISDYAKSVKKIVINNSIIKDLMKFFKDNIISLSLYINDERMLYTIIFSDNTLTFKLASSITVVK